MLLYFPTYSSVASLWACREAITGREFPSILSGLAWRKRRQKKGRNKRGANIPSSAEEEAVSCYSLAATQPSRAEREEGGGGLVPPSPLPWPRFSSLRTRFPAFVQCHSLEIGGGRGGKKPVSGRREAREGPSSAARYLL